MGLIEVNPDGLRAAANSHHSLAATVSELRPPELPTSAHQPTVRAAQLITSFIDAASHGLAARLSSNGVSLLEAADTFTENESNSVRILDDARPRAPR
jgi:hypothetical protein